MFDNDYGNGMYFGMEDWDRLYEQENLGKVSR